MGKGKPRHNQKNPPEVPAEKASLMWDISIETDDDGPQRVEISTDAGEVVVYSNAAVELPY